MLLNSILISSLTFGSVYLIGVTGPIVSGFCFDCPMNIVKGTIMTVYLGSNFVFLYCVYKALTM